MESLSALLALCEWDTVIITGFSSQRASNEEFDILDIAFVVKLHKLLNK